MNGSTLSSIYYSHSWFSEDVDINLAIWEAVWNHCQLMVDNNVDPNQETDPPFQVSRIEDAIRRCDAFLAVLLPIPRSTDETRPASAPDDSQSEYTGSLYSLFEVRLAERAREPRLILYDAQTRFKPEGTESQSVRYLKFNRDDIINPGAAIWATIGNWLAVVNRSVVVQEDIADNKASILLPRKPNHSQQSEAVRAALAAANFTDVVDLMTCSTDIEMLEALRTSRLLVVDASSEQLWDIYGMAHALVIPTIRVFQGEATPNVNNLPRVLRGHPVGYQDDLVVWSEITELREAVADRALRMRQLPFPITDRETGRAFFERRR